VFAISLLVAALQIGPFYQERTDFQAVRPFWSEEKTTTDVLWPVFTAHEDWWRFCFFTHYQENRDGGYQFEIMPLWFNGRTSAADEEGYWGFFPFYGSHPHLLLMHDLRFCLWPIWMQYRMPRPKENRWMETTSVCFPFVHWRDDGSWGFWPFYGVSYNRADDHRYALWPLFNWKDCRSDRDTGGAGTAWMFWPLVGRVECERESQWLFLPPFFSYAETPDGWRGRYPLPFIEIERKGDRDRTSVFPFYEHIDNRRFYDGEETTSITRFGWRLVELLPDETRVFPFYVGRDDYLRVWPFWESTRDSNGTWHGRTLALFPIRWVDSVDRNWAKFWTFYEHEVDAVETRHSLLWGLIRWRTSND